MRLERQPKDYLGKMRDPNLLPWRKEEGRRDVNRVNMKPRVEDQRGSS